MIKVSIFSCFIFSLAERLRAEQMIVWILCGMMHIWHWDINLNVKFLILCFKKFTLNLKLC